MNSGSWNNSNTVLLIQRRGRVVTTDYKNRQKTLLSALQLMSISQISTQKYGSGHFYPFKSQEKFVQ